MPFCRIQLDISTLVRNKLGCAPYMRTDFVVCPPNLSFCNYQTIPRSFRTFFLLIGLEMPRNVEIKAKITCLQTLLDTASKLCSGAKPQVIKQHDTFFTSKAGRLKLREFPGVVSF